MLFDQLEEQKDFLSQSFKGHNFFGNNVTSFFDIFT